MQELTFEVEAVITVTVPASAEDPAAEARERVDVILQRAWDTDQGRHHVRGWHFELMPDGAVTDVTAGSDTEEN